MAEIDIKKLKPNPNNPRIIKDEKFKKLVQSLKELPEMANVRPIVVNQDMIVLGGNMRLKAMQEAGWKKVPVEVVDWDEEKQRQFTIHFTVRLIQHVRQQFCVGIMRLFYFLIKIQHRNWKFNSYAKPPTLRVKMAKAML